MEEKQLDFNAPLLSVRRFSSMKISSEGEECKRNHKYLGKKPSLPPNKSAGSLRNPGSVPFFWEQIPGRPKDGGGSQFQTREQPPISPKLPPGRILEVKQQSSDKEPEGKNVSGLQNKKILSSCKESFLLDDSVSRLESSNGGMNEEGDSDLGDSDDAFKDALDTLSRTESSFFNWSVSGVSRMDSPDIKPSGTFSTDPLIRDFMMGRFLPAAKAMVSETPHKRKQPVTCEQQRQVEKVVNGDKRHSLHQYRSNVLPQYVQYTGEEESEDDNEYNDSRNLSAKTCGLFTRFCLRNSFCLLNPVPGIKVRSQAPIPPVQKVSTQVKTTAYSGSLGETNDEKNWGADYKHKLTSGLQLLDNSKLRSESNQLTCWSDSQTPDESSPFRHSGGGGIAPYANEAPPYESKVSSFHPNKSRHYNCHGIVSYHRGRQGQGSMSHTVEKTLYVDSVHAADTSNSMLSSSNTKELIDYIGKDSEILVEIRGMEQTPIAASCLLGINNSIISKGGRKLQQKISEVVGSSLQSSYDQSYLGEHRENMEGFRKADGLGQESRFLMGSKVPISGHLEFNETQPLNTDGHENFNVSSLVAPLPPPLPKLPSESWLLRTVPSISSRNDARFHPRKQTPKTSMDPKWETIGKTSNVHQGHLQFSEGPTTIVSQQPKT